MADTSSLSGKYAIITGSTQGLGEAVARLFVERGAAGLILCGRNVERGQAARGRSGRTPGSAARSVLEVRDEREPAVRPELPAPRRPQPTVW